MSKNLCLNMIVKNESKIITRLLESVVSYIDCYCICDTGSTDNTIQIIEEFFQQHNIEGKIIHEPFKNFGHNRTVALKACCDINATHVLLLDADMVFSVGNKNILKNLKNDAYFIFQGSENFSYKNVRIVRNIGLSYNGVTHEFLDLPVGFITSIIDKTDIFIRDIGDGGSKTNKFARDIALLEKGIIDEPNNKRYLFYLANSYKNIGQTHDAINMYKKVIDANGWNEEVWYSYYSIGLCYRDLGDFPNALYWWIEGYNFYPHRVENLYEIVKYYRLKGKNKMAHVFYCLAEEILQEKHTDHLFMENDIYDYKLYYELSIIGYYININKPDLAHCCMKLFNTSNGANDASIIASTISNYKFYVPTIGSEEYSNKMKKENLDVLLNIGNSISSDFSSSTPSFCKYDDTCLMFVVRYVNYRIADNGQYIQNVPQIITKNACAIIDVTTIPWTNKKEFILEYDTTHDTNNVYLGIEDVRLINSSNKIYFTGNRGINYGNICVEYGCIDDTHTNSSLVQYTEIKPVEKNWVLFEDINENIKVVYGWHPLTIGNIQNNKFVHTHSIQTPPICKLLRGSTNGVKINNEIWFVCHAVSYEMPRFYYHIIIVLDAVTYNVLRYTPLFKFSKRNIEFCLGFMYIENLQSFLFGYSVNDGETKYSMFEKTYIENEFICVGH